MSVIQHVFIGPYAEYQVPEGEEEVFPPVGDDGELLAWESLQCDEGMGGRRPTCYRYLPHSRETGAALRRMYFAGKDGAVVENQDLTDVDRQAEMNWLSTAFAPELQLLTSRYGSPPVIRWGVVSWFS